MYELELGFWVIGMLMVDEAKEIDKAPEGVCTMRRSVYNEKWLKTEPIRMLRDAHKAPWRVESQ